jgi:hypothetical protein
MYSAYERCTMSDVRCTMYDCPITHESSAFGLAYIVHLTSYIDKGNLFSGLTKYYLPSCLFGNRFTFICGISPGFSILERDLRVIL